MLTYKGYTGHVIYDDEALIFHGEVEGLRAVITFQGTSVDEIEKAFRESVDDYLEWCRKRGKSPEKAYSGKFNLRMPPDLHAKIASSAMQQGMSLNAYINRTLRSSA